MLQRIHQLYGKKLGASDGEIGRVKDVYFDDQSWVILYLVADTGSWLSGRQVLLSPHALGALDQSGKVLPVNLTCQQIEQSPPIESHKPVSRQYEEAYHQYYGWPCYWLGTRSLGITSYPISELPSPPFPHEGFNTNGEGLTHVDAHLRGAKSVNGHQVEASDGMVGRVCDFLIDSASWSIDRLVIATGSRWQAKEVEISTDAVERISYEKSTVYLKISIDRFEQNIRQQDVPELATV
jgi:sporulation protein YlmC with PRC-barrel domain